jgi:hypothetical protein
MQCPDLARPSPRQTTASGLRFAVAAVIVAAVKAVRVGDPAVAVGRSTTGRHGDTPAPAAGTGQPDQLAALRRLRATFGSVEVLEVIDHRDDQDQATMPCDNSRVSGRAEASALNTSAGRRHVPLLASGQLQ